MDERTRYGARHYRIGLLGLTGQRETTTEGPDSRSFTRLPDGTLISLRIGTATSYTSSYYTLDELGTVLALTDAAGTTDTARYTYDPYGTILTRTGTWSGLTHHPFRFVGGVANDGALADHLKFGTRYVSSASGTWTQPDPPRADPNTYQYAGSNPCNAGDPTGRVPWCAISAISLAGNSLRLIGAAFTLAAGLAAAPPTAGLSLYAAIANLAGTTAAEVGLVAAVYYSCF